MPTVPLQEVIGRSLHKLRTSRNWTQDQLAGHLRQSGLNWTRAQVTDLERGRRQDVTLAEALLLAEAFGIALATLVPAEGAIRLGDTERPARAVHDLLAGNPPVDSDLRGPTEIPGMPHGPHWVRVGPGRSSEVYTSAEVDMARRLNYPVRRISATSRRLWEGGLDARIEQGETAELAETLRQALGAEDGAPPA